MLFLLFFKENIDGWIQTFKRPWIIVLFYINVEKSESYHN